MEKLTGRFSEEFLKSPDCQRCGGIMVDDYFFGRLEAFEGRRCVQCGNVIDSVILMNRLCPPAQTEDQCNSWDSPEPTVLDDFSEAA